MLPVHRAWAYVESDSSSQLGYGLHNSLADTHILLLKHAHPDGFTMSHGAAWYQWKQTHPGYTSLFIKDMIIARKQGNLPVGGGVGVVLPYLGMVVRFRGDDPRFGDFQSDWVPILYLNTIRLTLSFCRKNRLVSITFSSRDIRT